MTGRPPHVDQERFRLLLRIYAEATDLDIRLAKGLQDLTIDDSRVGNRYLEQDEGIAGWEFVNAPGLSGPLEVSKWQRRAFLNAADWLRDKSPTLFQPLRDAGNKVDVCVVGYNGPIPSDLLKELGRLGLGLYIIGLPHSS
jgi:hypothetical protein